MRRMNVVMRNENNGSEDGVGGSSRKYECENCRAEFPIKPQWIGICYFVGHWRIYAVAAAVVVVVVYHSRHMQTLPTMH